MKKFKKNLFIFALLLFIPVTTVLATIYSFSLNGTLTNTIDGNTVTRKPIYGEASLGGIVTATVTNIKNVSGTNAKGGIRVHVNAKRKVLLGIWNGNVSKYYSDDNHQAPSLTNTADMSTTLKVTGTGGTVRVEWENHTGNTSFFGTFSAK